MERAALVQEFTDRFPGTREVCVARAPGRVNLIGEHTDYNGLPVLPMTLAQDIQLAFASRSDGIIRIRDTDTSYPEAAFQNAARIAPSAPGSWENYCKATIQALNLHFRPSVFPGMDMLSDGTVPVAAGLSSSSALVVACALAYLRALGRELDKDISRLELASLLADGEQYVGTRGGGMDHAIILLGRPGCACKIDFYPLRVEYAPLLEGYAFVVCNTLVKAAKTGEALHLYNAGPLSCKLICALVEKKTWEEFGDEIELQRLGDLWQGHLCLTNGEVTGLFDRTFPKETTTLLEAARALDLSPREVRERWLRDLNEPEGGFPLRARARHQITEYRRVELARDALLAGDPHEFGRLLNASHESCAHDYFVSGPELDALVAIARENGALGARLTGAGFVGCTVNLVPKERLNPFVQAIEEEYFAPCREKCGTPLPDSRILMADASESAGYR